MDPLTGLPQRREFWEQVDASLPNLDRDVCMLTVNIEHFSYYNKWYGHEEGDRLLARLGEFLRQFAEVNHLLAGYMGADIFSVFFTADEDVLELLRAGIVAIMNTVKDSEIFRPIFGGYLLKKGMEARAIDLFDYTVNAIGQAMGSLNSSIYWFDERMARQMIAEMELMPRVLKGMDKAQFTFYLQPKCQMRDGRIVGAEVLMRWVTETGEVIKPDDFIPALEKNGYIIQLDKYIWEKACQLLARWKRQGKRMLPISVNISRIDILRLDVVEIFRRLLEKYDVPINYLELEITESAYVENEAIIKEAEVGLRKLGLKILIDDFGSGYSSLNMLKDVQADVLKLDMNFLMMNEQNFEKGKNIVRSVIAMANQIDLPVIAEGVETAEQVEMLLSLGCYYAQGYHFYRPMPIAHYELLIADENKVALPNVSSRKSGAAYLRDLAQYFAMVAEVNPFTGEYHFIHQDASFRFAGGRKPDTITEYIDNCVQKGEIHPDDAAGYMRKTSLEYIRERLMTRSLRVLYDLRYKRDAAFKWYTFECLQPKNFSLEEPWVLFTWKRSHIAAPERLEALNLMHHTFRKVVKIDMKNGIVEVLKKNPDENMALYKGLSKAVDFTNVFSTQAVYPTELPAFEKFVDRKRLQKHFQESDAVESFCFHYRNRDKYLACVLEIAKSIEFSKNCPVLLATIRDL